MNYLKTKNSQQKQVIDLEKIKPQIYGFNQDIYDPNLKIDVFDPYFYQVMITRFSFYIIPLSTIYSMIVQFYDNNNFQSKAQEFFSIIKMPNQTDSNYKKALIKVFTLTLFEYITNHNNDFYYKDFNNTFLKYFLCDSIYNNDFKNLVSSNDLDNIEFLINEIIYLFPKNIVQIFNNIASPNNLYILNKNINYCCLEYYGPPPNYSEINMDKIKITRDDIIANDDNDDMYLIGLNNPIWNLLREKTQIYQFRINNGLYQPIIDYLHMDFIDIPDKIYYDTYFENLDYYNQKFKGKAIINLCNCNYDERYKQYKQYIYYYTIIGYIIYKDDISQAYSIINNLTLSITKKRIKVFIFISICILTTNMEQSFINKQLNNKNAIFDLILEIIKKKIIRGAEFHLFIFL